ncbi:MAG TPA: glucose 1-dehydrogenase [bacterium]|nr:glucose 1-dehydrogenase [bacterium]
MFTIDLADQRAVVTGSSTGIGRATAIMFAEAGADVGIHYAENEKEAEQTAAEVRARGRRAALVRGDFREPKVAGRAVTDAIDQLGGSLDILVNNAGSVLKRVPFDEMESELWDDVINLNLTSVFHATRAALPRFSAGARIVNISSLAALNGGGLHAFAYAASKGGLISLTRSLAKELAPRGIRVNAVAPGVTATPFHERFSTPELLEKVRQSLPLRRLGTPEDCAAAVLYLVSRMGTHITGEVVEVNGGEHFG